MSLTILSIVLAGSVSALLPAKVPGRVRGVYSAPLASSALLSMRSRPPYMSTDPDALAQIAAAGYSSGFRDGMKAAAMAAVVGDAQAEEQPFCPESIPTKLALPSTPESRCKDAAKHIKGVDGPLLQTLATVCCTIENLPELYLPGKIPWAVYEPEDDGPVDDQLDQPYKVTIGGAGALDVFNSELASYGTVIDGSITDYHGDFEVTVPPFAALVVQPKDETEVRTLPEVPDPVSRLFEIAGLPRLFPVS